MFNILKYIQPTWYYNLRPFIGHGYFPSLHQISSKSLCPDTTFSAIAANLELSYRLHKSGHICRHCDAGLDWWSEHEISLLDEYKFARKNFNSSRVLLAMGLRIITFHNPFNEIAAFLKSAGIKKQITTCIELFPEEYLHFNSTLIESKPKVTVIIPTLNRYDYLRDVMLDLESQNYSNFNVIVIDQSQPFREDFYTEFKLSLKVIRQEEKALWLARNHAVYETASEYLLFYDDDSRVGKDWIHQHLKCIDYFKADISSGVSISKTGGEIPANYSYFHWSDQLDTGNVMIKRNVFRTTGLYDRQFERQRMGDGEFGLRAYLAGFKNISNPLSKRLHLKVKEGGLREMGSWDAYRPGSFWSPRPIPSVLYFYRKYFGTKATLISLLINIPPSVIPYKYKRNKQLLVVGSLFAILLMPLIIIQIIRSWRKSSAMLKNPLIPVLND